MRKLNKINEFVRILSDCRKAMFLCIIGLCAVSSSYGQSTDSLSLEYSSFVKLFKTYKSDGFKIPKDSFRSMINSNETSNGIYQKGRNTKLAAGIAGGVSLGAFVYFTRQWLAGDVLENPPPGYFASMFGVVGASMLHLKGKNTVQVAINEYNGSLVSKHNPFRINVNTGFPTYGVFNLIDAEAKLSQQRSLGVGVEAHLFQEYFGFVDVYSQSCVTDFGETSIDKMVWHENGYTVMSGIGTSYSISPKLEITTKAGIGVTSLNRTTFFRDKFFSEDKDERIAASQLGVGLRYFPLEHLGVDVNANLTTSTPLVNFGITAAF